MSKDHVPFLLTDNFSQWIFPLEKGQESGEKEDQRDVSDQEEEGNSLA